METLEKQCGEKVDIGNLYRTLRRMEMDGWVESDWSKNESGQDKRTYKITKEGTDFLKTAVSSLSHTDALIHRFLERYSETYEKGISV